MNNELKSVAEKIKIVITDVDGVLTDGTIYKGNDGREFKRFSILDGAGVVLARSAELKIVLLSGRFSPATAARAKELGLSDDCYQGEIDKLKVYKELKTKYDFSDEEAAFLGDDFIDLPVMEKVGLPIASANAVSDVKKKSKYVTEVKGGEGAFREAIEMILKLQGKYDTAIKHFQQMIHNHRRGKDYGEQ